MTLAQQVGVIWPDLLVSVGLCPSVRVSNRCLVRNYENKKLLRVGRHWFSSHHWTCLYGVTPTRTLEHDVYRTMVWNAYRPENFAIDDCPYNEDMAMQIGAESYRVEIDRETEGRERLVGRFKKYADCTDQILFITLTHSRIRLVRRWAHLVSDIIFFTTIDQAVALPYEPIYTDCAGERYAVPQSVPNPGNCGTPTPP